MMQKLNSYSSRLLTTCVHTQTHYITFRRVCVGDDVLHIGKQGTTKRWASTGQGIGASPPVENEKAKMPKSSVYRFLFRNFCPLDFQLFRRAVDVHSDAKDVGFLMPQFVPAVLIQGTQNASINRESIKRQMSAFVQAEDLNFFKPHTASFDIRTAKATFDWQGKMITPPYFDQTDSRRPNQLYLLLCLFRWLSEGIRTHEMEVHTLLHDFEDLENISRTRPTYIGRPRPDSEIVKIRKHFVAFLQSLIERLEEYYSLKNTEEMQKEEKRDEVIMFAVMCRTLISNIYIRVDPKNLSVNRYEIEYLSLGQIHEQSEYHIQQKVVDETVREDNFFALDRTLTHFKLPAHIKLPLRVGTPRFVPPILRRHSFAEVPFDYELYRMARFLNIKQFKSAKAVLHDGAAAVLQSPLLDVAMLEPALIDLWRPPFQEFESTLAQKGRLASKWLIWNAVPSTSPDGTQYSLFDEALVTDVIDSSGSPPLLARSFVALMTVPPQLIKGILTEGAVFIDETERALGKMLAKDDKVPTGSSEGTYAPNKRLPLMAGLRYKLHPGHLPPPLDKPLQVFVNEVKEEEKYLFSIPPRQRKAKDMIVYEKRKRLAQRSHHLDNIFHDPHVFCYEVYDKMPDHPIDFKHLRKILSLEVQCGANLDKRMIYKFPQLFTDVTPPGIYHIHFQRADLSKAFLKDYFTVSDEELVQTFMGIIRDHRDTVEEGLYSAEGILSSAGDRLSKALRFRYDTLEGFFRKFPEHFEVVSIGQSSKGALDILFRMPNRSMTNLWLPAQN